MLRTQIISALAIMALGCIGCSSPAKKEVPSNQLLSAPKSQQLEGVVEKIKEIPKTASIWDELGGVIVGAAVGSQIGEGQGEDIAEDVGSVAGETAADQKYGKSIDELSVKGGNNQTYTCYVQGHQFTVGQAVTFSLVDGKITAIVPK
ncbi:hypothetical protein P3T73_17185 [Kiritimatiellota bacterium B12222]|nr:hypothetical protein P3T73_17185 [Kiritimatiellota bacterium B12222]